MDANPQETYLAAARLLGQLDVVYLHVAEADWDDAPPDGGELQAGSRDAFPTPSSTRASTTGPCAAPPSRRGLGRRYAGRPFVAKSGSAEPAAPRFILASDDPAALFGGGEKADRLSRYEADAGLRRLSSVETTRQLKAAPPAGPACCLVTATMENGALALPHSIRDPHPTRSHHELIPQAWCWHASASQPAHPHPGFFSALVPGANDVPPPIGSSPSTRWTETHRAWLTPVAARPCQASTAWALIVALGANVSHLRLGTSVAYHTDLRHGGSFCPPRLVPARALLPVPDALSDEGGGRRTALLPGLTARQALAKLPRSDGRGAAHHWAGSNVGAFRGAARAQAGTGLPAPATSPWLAPGSSGCKGSPTIAITTGWPSCRPPTGGEPFEGIIDLVSSQQAGSLVAGPWASAATW